MNAKLLDSDDKSRRKPLFLLARMPVALIAAICLSLGSAPGEARIKIDDGGDPIEDGGGGTPLPPPPPPPPQAAPPLSYAAWTTAHGGSDNTGFAKVVTAPAVAASAIVDVGPLAPGANPVTGPDGTVYIGNLNGELIALRPDGSLHWKRKLESTQGGMFGGIHASPVVSEDGSVFVVSGYGVRDHRAGAAQHYGAFSFLHKFTPGGGWLGSAQFPQHNRISGATKAPPNIWRHNGAEAIIIPVQFGQNSEFTHMVAFSTNLSVLADLPISPGVDITGGGPEWLETGAEIAYCFLPGTGTFEVLRWAITGHSYCTDDVLGFSTSPLVPANNVALYSYLGDRTGVAIRQRYANESPHIFVSDGPHITDELTFDINTGFKVINGTRNNERVNLSPPVALPWGIVIGKHTPHEIRGGISFEPEQRYLWLDGDIIAAPTITPNGRIATVDRNGWLSTVIQGSLELQQWNNGPSIASAASSCTHLFVAVENELVTYDLSTLQPVNRLPWADGGKHSTIIGPAGHVYATSEGGIYVFPPEPNRDPKDTAGTQCL